MTSGQEPLLERAADLRRSFDESFSEPTASVVEEPESLLALRAGGIAYAVRLGEIAGLFVDRTIVRLPSPVPELLGVAGLRHEAVPVYSLPGLLGHALRGERLRWLIVARSAQPVAFAFEEFEGYLRVQPAAILPSKDAGSSGHVQASVRLADGMRGLVGMASLVESLEQQVRRAGTT